MTSGLKGNHFPDGDWKSVRNEREMRWAVRKADDSCLLLANHMPIEGDRSVEFQPKAIAPKHKAAGLISSTMMRYCLKMEPVIQKNFKPVWVGVKETPAHRTHRARCKRISRVRDAIYYFSSNLHRRQYRSYFHLAWWKHSARWAPYWMICPASSCTLHLIHHCANEAIKQILTVQSGWERKKNGYWLVLVFFLSGTYHFD